MQPTRSSRAARALTVAAAAATLLAPGALGQASRYIRIYRPTPTAAMSYINLGEILVFGCDGTQIVPVDATLSGTYSGCYPASACIDAQQTNTSNVNGCAHAPVSMCHSTASHSPWLQVDLGPSAPVVGRVLVLNREDCCQDRVVGFQIGLFAGANGTSPVGQPQTFASTAPRYTFTFGTGSGCLGGSPTPASGASPTVAASSPTVPPQTAARYVRIFLPPGGPANSIINLGDVMVYDCNGNFVQAIDATLSSNHSSQCFTADKCIDSEQTNSTNITHCSHAPTSMCHSSPGDPAPWLQVDLGAPTRVARVFVVNRVNCCQDRIVPFQIGLFAGADGTMPVGGAQAFVTARPTYTFRFQHSCETMPPTTSSPTLSPRSPARYVRIFLPAPVSGAILNLGEALAYDCAGNYIAPVGAVMSSQYSSCFPADRCIDSEQTNSTTDAHCTRAPLSMCHSRVGDTSPALEIDLGPTPTVVSRVMVINRADCCASRIVGFRVGLFAGANGARQIGASQAFTSTQPSYTFYFGAGCPPGAPTSVPSAPVAQPTMLVTSPTMPPQTATRYVRIFLPAPVSGAIINLGDIMVSDCSGKFVRAVDATMSSIHGSSCFPADRCIDFEETNSSIIASHCANSPLSMCHSQVGDSQPWVQVDLGTPTRVGRVQVLNRGDCCQARIVGFQIGLFAGPNATLPIGAPQVFTSTKSLYTFEFNGCSASSVGSSGGGGGNPAAVGGLVVVILLVAGVGVFLLAKRRKAAQYRLQIDHYNPTFDEDNDPVGDTVDAADDDDLIGM